MSHIRDGNSSHTSVAKIKTRDLTWTRETRKKHKSFGIGVYMNVSLRKTSCLKKKV